MDNAIHLSEVQQLNLHFLLTIQAGLKQDRVATSYKFRLDPDCEALLSEVTAGDLVALAPSMPDESLFLPIGNLPAVLTAPAGLAVTLRRVGASLPAGKGAPLAPAGQRD
ncbi:MAG: flagellar transcriptional regulator FlhD [Burkholderiaceae bacterium]|nr:flagellar transcriptional regulator FlhD [Burkholderiaceae bacterium]